AASDPDLEQLTYGVVAGLPAGAQFLPSTGQFVWTPSYEQAGDYTVRFAATDPGSLTDTLDVPIHIDNVDRAPTLQVSDHALLVGRSSALQLAASDPDLGAVLRYSATGLPMGATLDPVTGQFNWTSGPTDLGDHVINFS